MTDLFLRPLFTWRSAVASKHGPAPTTRHVLLTLSLYMSEKGDSCYPATRTLAQDTGLSHRAVLTHLETAEREGWLGRRERLMRGKGWKRMEYFAVIPPGIEEAIKTEKGDERPSPPERGEGASPAIGDERGDVDGERRSLGGERGDADVVNNVHLKSSVNTSKTTTKNTVRRPGEDYVPSASVLEWVKENGYEPYLKLHVEQFRDSCTTQQRKPYSERGLDAAFRKCVREDWGDVRRKAQMEARARGERLPHVPNPAEWWATPEDIRAKGRELNVRHYDDPDRLPNENFDWLKAKVFVAAGDGPWMKGISLTLERLMNKARELTTA